MNMDVKGVLVDELRDILSAEEQILKALPAVIKAAECPELKAALSGHLQETRGQVQRLKKIFTELRVKARAKLCKGMKGLIDECKETIKQYSKKSPVRDMAMIAKAQRVEHYEIAAYGAAYCFARELGLEGVMKLLHETLEEEKKADKKLTEIALGGFAKAGVNHTAKLCKSPKFKKKAA